jgi:hypothetical protein
MWRIRVLPLVLTAAFVAAGFHSLYGQTPSEQIPDTSFKGRPVPAPIEPKPFSVEAPKKKLAFSIEFRSAEEMSEKDRLLVADASIAEHAGFAGFELDRTTWSYQQMVCPALPNHLFLRYMRNNGTGDVSVFSASIPRDGGGRVRVIPILRRGYSLFSPAPINALTISAFNHIRAEEPELNSSEWLGNGLCYAALAGAHPQIVSADARPAINKPIPAFIAILDVQIVPKKGEQVIRFADASAVPRPMEWTMTFTRQGKLIKATHSAAPMMSVSPVSQKSAVAKTWPVPTAGQN